MWRNRSYTKKLLKKRAPGVVGTSNLLDNEKVQCVIEMMINGRHVRVLIDTGSSVSIVLPMFCKNIVHKRQSVVRGVGNTNVRVKGEI